jgi:hypothetical protein
LPQEETKKINHVALVVEVTPAEVGFVHATVSQGHHVIMNLIGWENTAAPTPFKYNLN